MRLYCKALAVMAVVLLPAGASAITLTNHDKTAQKLTVIEGDNESERVLKPGEKIEFCEKSCVIRTSGGESYAFDGGETVALEDGLLFLVRSSGHLK